MNKTIIICLSLSALLIMGSGGQKVTSGIIKSSSLKTATIKVMTFNIRVDTFLDGFNGWKNRRPIVCDILTNNAADVVGVQEALLHQVEQIQQALPQYSNYMAGRNNGKQKGESCTIFYRKDRFTLDDSGTFWFSDTPAKPGSKGWGNLWPRICSWVHLVNKETGAGFYVYNVHLDVLSQNSRQKSAELLASRIAARKLSDPFIVMGDFNMGLDNPAMVYLQNIGSQNPSPRMIDAWQSTRHDLTDGEKAPRIDHIVLSDNALALNVTVDRYNVDGRYPSDHFPVVANIFLNTSPQNIKPVALDAKTEKSLLN